jgi:hypothetical protein
MPAQRKTIDVRRINVAVNSEILAAIDLLIDHEGITLTEAVRRLISYGDFVYRAVREKNAEVLIKGSDGVMREVVLL